MHVYAQAACQGFHVQGKTQDSASERCDAHRRTGCTERRMHASQRRTCKAIRERQARNTARKPTSNMRSNTRAPSPQYRPQANAKHAKQRANSKPAIPPASATHKSKPNNPSAHMRPYPRRTMLSIAPSRLHTLPNAQRPHRSSRHGRCMSTYRMAVVTARLLTAIQARRSLAQSPRPWP